MSDAENRLPINDYLRQKKVSRRHFLTGGALAAVGLVLSGCKSTNPANAAELSPGQRTAEAATAVPIGVPTRIESSAQTTVASVEQLNSDPEVLQQEQVEIRSVPQGRQFEQIVFKEPNINSEQLPAGPYYIQYLVPADGNGLGYIASLYGTDAETLRRVNQERYSSLKKDPDTLKPGWQLTVPTNQIPARVREISGWDIDANGQVVRRPTQFDIALGFEFYPGVFPWGVPGDELWVPVRYGKNSDGSIKRNENGLYDFQYVASGPADEIVRVFYNRLNDATFSDAEVVEALNSGIPDPLGSSLETLTATTTLTQALAEFNALKVGQVEQP